MKKIIIFLVRIYQRMISPLFPPRCRYMPSCSAYMIDSLKKYGLIKGLIKGFFRIVRCNPFSSGGYDPA